MKLKPSVRIRPGKMTAGMTLVDDEPRADMFFPAWFFSLALICFVFGVIMAVVFIAVRLPLFLILIALVMILFGIVTIAWWKNQTIRMLPNDTFVYSTFLGKKTVYSFHQIKGIKRGIDSVTLYVGEGKVHIESVAILTDRLVQRFDQRLKELEQKE